MTTKEFCKVGLLLAAFLMGMGHPIHAQAPAGYTLLYEENFSGNKVNEADWNYRIGHRGGVTEDFDSYNRKENVSVHDGTLHIAVRREKIDGEEVYTGGGLISKHQFGYGYYETLSRPFMAGKGVHSSFWQTGGPNYKPNNDIFEIDSYEVNSKWYLVTNNLYMHLKAPIGTDRYPTPLASLNRVSFDQDGWYLDGYEYTPDGVIFYDNGKVVAHAEYKDLTAAQVVWLTALNGVKHAEPEKMPGESQFKYFRYYAKDYPGINILPNGDFEYNQQVSHTPVVWDQSGTADSSLIETGNAIHGNYFLRQGNATKPYQVTTSQSLEYILNGNYMLTAMVRSSGGQEVAQLKVSGFGGKDIYFDIPATDKWKPIRIPVIPVANQSVTVSIVSKGQPKQWMEIDNIQFMKPPLPGQLPRDPVPFTSHHDPIWQIAQKYPLDFEGGDTVIFLSKTVGYGDAVSITFLMNPKQLANMSPITKSPQTGNSGWSIYLTALGEIGFRIGSHVNHEDVIANHAYKANQLERVACVFDSGVASIYVNGKLLKRQSGILTNTMNNQSEGKLGNVGDIYKSIAEMTVGIGSGSAVDQRSTSYTGTISDLSIYNRALSNKEILALGGKP
jgi:hypothetical protein